MTAELTEWNVTRSRSRGTKRWSVYGPDVLDLTVAEMDLPTAPPILEAMRDAVDRQTFGYPMPADRSGLPEIAASWLDTRHGLRIGPGAIRLLPELMCGVTASLNLFTSPRSPVVVPTPTYRSFFGAIHHAGRQVLERPMLQTDTGYGLDLDGIDEGLAAGAEAVLLCNPANPIGRVFDVTELTALADVVARHDGARVISDEIHAPLRYGREFVPYAAVDERTREHSVTLFGASKAWNIAGLRTGFIALTRAADRRVWDAMPFAATSGVSPLGMIATGVAFRDGHVWLNEALEMLDVNRTLVKSTFDAAGLPNLYQPPEGTYLAWLDLRVTGLANPAAPLLDRHRVATTPGPDHGAAGAGFVRMNFATEPDILREAIRRIVAFVEENTPATG